MNILSAITIGIHSLFHQKIRTFLTMLGIIFGVAAVISMLSIGYGAGEEIRRQIEEYGARNIIIRAETLGKQKLMEAKRAYSVGLSVEDAKYIKKVCPFITDIAPQVVVDKEIKYHDRNPKCKVVGIDTAYFKLFSLKPALGRLVIQDDVENYRTVCVLGSEIKRDLFYNSDPVGEQIVIGGLRFTVIGTLPEKSHAGDSGTGNGSSEQKGVASIKSRNVNRDIYIPLATALMKFSFGTSISGYKNSEEDPLYHRVSEIILSVSSEKWLKEAGKVLSGILSRRHKGVDDVEIVIPLEILEQSQKTQEIFSLVLALIAGLSLLVGGIGIMNIMLASVHERTKEIGIRKAVGASKQDILLQFLIEGLLISSAGGLIGIILGLVISRSVSNFLEWKTIVTAASVLLSFSVAFVVGVFFSFFPAWKAANLDPIEALRYE